jgi:hypothetical protein
VKSCFWLEWLEGTQQEQEEKVKTIIKEMINYGGFPAEMSASSKAKFLNTYLTDLKETIEEKQKEDLRAWLKGATPLLKPPEYDTKEMQGVAEWGYQIGFDDLKKRLLAKLEEK